MFRKIKHLAAAASVAAVAATIIVTGTTAGVASARVLNPAGSGAIWPRWCGPARIWSPRRSA